MAHEHLHVLEGGAAVRHGAHSHAHRDADHHHEPHQADEHAHDHGAPARAGFTAPPSTLLAPATLRLGCAALALIALWSGVAWAIG